MGRLAPAKIGCHQARSSVHAQSARIRMSGFAAAWPRSGKSARRTSPLETAKSKQKPIQESKLPTTSLMRCSVERLGIRIGVVDPTLDEAAGGQAKQVA